MEDITNKIANITRDARESFRLKRCAPCSGYVGFWSGKKSWEVDGATYCRECIGNNFKFCECCEKIVGRLRLVDGKKICSHCLRNKTNKCEDCGKRKLNSDLGEYGYREHLCTECYRRASRSFRRINIGQRKVESRTFVKNNYKRYCGIEIECLNNNKDANSFILKELKKYGFSQGTDGSLSSGGVEFRSVPMNGDLLFESIEKFGKKLNERRYRIDRSCGLHVHLEVEKELEYLKKLYLFYLRFEDMFFNMLPKSRRSISYCGRFKNYYRDTTEEIMEVATLDKFKEMLYETRYYRSEIRSHGNSKRYCWANLHSIFYRGTLEIRNHSGTTDYSKIINWIMIHQRVLEFLDEKSLEEIGTMKVTKKAFLDIFNKPIQNYIKRRWVTFVKLEEKDFKARAPVYINSIPTTEDIKNV